jgi:hypothetical protein
MGDMTDDLLAEEENLASLAVGPVPAADDRERLATVRDYVVASLTISALDRDRLLTFIDGPGVSPSTGDAEPTYGSQADPQADTMHEDPE